MDPSLILAIFSPREMSRSGGRLASAWAGCCGGSLSSLILNTLWSGAVKMLSDHVFPDCPNLQINIQYCIPSLQRRLIFLT